MFEKIRRDKKLKNFFSKFDMKIEFLLAFSGGVDSTFLFYVLKAFSIRFTAVYIDHGWRPESSQEVESLRELCLKENIRFETTVIPNSLFNKGNCENTARTFRYRFFKELVDREGFGGVFLAHHADDQSETLIKRLFEGATLWNLRGLATKTTIDGLLIFRPLLHLRKDFFLDCLAAERISYLIDSSNQDKKFLRVRMRSELIPFMEKIFGKNVTSSFARLSQYSNELFEFLSEVADPYLKRIVRNDTCMTLDMSDAPHISNFLWTFILKHFFSLVQITPSLLNLESIIGHLRKKGSQKILRVGNQSVLVDKGTLTIFLTREILL